MLADIMMIKDKGSCFNSTLQEVRGMRVRKLECENQCQDMGLSPEISGGYSWEFLVGVYTVHVLTGSPNPDPISDQKCHFFTPTFRPGVLTI